MTAPGDQGREDGTGDDDDRTRIGEPLSQPPEGAPDGGDDPDRTIFGAPQPTDPPPSANEDPDRTVFGGQVPDTTAPPADDPDRTVFGAPPPSQPPDPDRTVIGGTNAPAADPDRTVAGDAGSAGPDRTVAGSARQPDPDATAAAMPPIPPPHTLTGTEARAAARSGALAVGTIINNNYRVEEVLNAGGMGRVYRGVEIGTGDPVAIKVVLPELAEDDKVGLMFKREARTLRQLQDDAIVRYYNYVHDTELDCYALVMEFISGVPLSDHVNEGGPISVEEGKTLLRRLAKGLQKAHDRDVVHRDLSPDNVMLEGNKIDQAVIIDFGIAKSNVVKESTMAGQFAGKLKYVSPEQLGAYGGEVGPRSDIYSLSLLMAAALMGQAVDMGSSIVEAVQRRQAVPDLSEVPPDLRPILSYMLEPDPAMRPRSMNHVIELLDDPTQIPPQHLAGLPLPKTAIAGQTTASRTTMPGFVQAAPVAGFQAPPTTGTAAIAETTGAPVRRRGGGGLGLLLGLFMVVALIGGGGYAWYAGYLSFLPPFAEVFGMGPPPDEPDPEMPTAPERLINSPEGFLAAAAEAEGECRYATLARSDRIDAYADAPGAFTGLATAYEEKFGVAPATVPRIVETAQCPVLDFARAFQGTELTEVQVLLDTDAVRSGERFDGTVIDPEDRSLWFVLIAPNGRVFRLDEGLSAPLEGRRSFGFALQAGGTEPQPYILMAVASEEGLVRAAAAQDRTESSVLLPLVQRELEQKGSLGVVGLAYLQVYPPGAEIPSDANTPDSQDDTPDENVDRTPPNGEATNRPAAVTPDSLRALVDGSDLSTIQKAALVALIDQAEANPDLLEGAVQMIEAALAGIGASD